jgi:hypothetical protein
MNLNNAQNPKESVMSLLNKIIKDPHFFRARFTIIFSIAISFVTIFYNNVLFSCQLSLLQNALLVYITTLMLLSISNIPDRSERIKLGISIATILGAFYAGITLLIGIVQYDFFGFREQVFSATGLVAPQITVQTFLTALGSQIILWLMLILISAFAGFLASITNLNKISR